MNKKFDTRASEVWKKNRSHVKSKKFKAKTLKKLKGRLEAFIQGSIIKKKFDL